MSISSHRPSATTTVLTRVALGLLALSVLLTGAVLFPTARSMADSYPEFAHLEGPLVAAAIAFGVWPERLSCS